MAVDKSGGRTRRGRMVREQRHILIVDDEDSLAFFLRQGLQEADAAWEVDIASNGEEAIIRINRYAYGLVIADLRMPGLNGLELIQMVRALEPNTKVILMTAYGSNKVEEEAKRLHVFRYVQKPFSIEDMKEWALEALEGWSASAAMPPPRIARDAATSPPAEERPSRALEPSAAETLLSSGADKEAVSSQALRGANAELPPGDFPPLDQLRSQLAQLRFRSGSKHIVLAHVRGQIVAESGASEDDRTLSWVPACAQAVASLLGAGEQAAGVTLLLQQGPSDGLCCVGVGQEWLLLAAYAPNPQAERLATVLGLMQGASRALSKALASLHEQGLEAKAVTPQRVETGPTPDWQREQDRPMEADLSTPETPPEAPSESAKDVRRVDQASSLAEPEFLLEDEGQEAETELADEQDPESEEEEIFSLDQAQAMGLIDQDVLARILGEQPDDS